MLLDLLDMLGFVRWSGILLAGVPVSVKLLSTVTIDVRDSASPLCGVAQMVHMPRKRIEFHDLGELIQVRDRPAGRALAEARRGAGCRCGDQSGLGQEQEALDCLPDAMWLRAMLGGRVREPGSGQCPTGRAGA